jgi:hypothetical protein
MILIDPLVLWNYRGRRLWCHMASDHSVNELHSFAKLIGMNREWFQDKAGKPHYDLTEARRDLAVARGAHQVTTEEMLWKCSRSGVWKVSPRIRARLERENFLRADGRCVCPYCSKPYYDHPQDSVDTFLNVLCCGRRVKL